MFYVVYGVIVLVGIVLISAIFHLLMKKRLNESNSILWICIGIVIILAGIFPKAVVNMSNFFFISYPPAFIFTVAILFLLFIVLKNTINISELTAKVQEAAMESSILRQELFVTKKEFEQLMIHLEEDKKEDNKEDSKEGSESY